MPDFRYAQFCPIARAAEIVGERWTILIVRELLFGQQRFSDLRRRLSGVSPSVLSERLTLLEQRGLVSKSDLAPPAASVVYELTEAGRGLSPVIMALAQWGSQFLLPIRAGEALDPDRLRFGLGLYARRSSTSAHCLELRVPVDGRIVAVHARSGAEGTTVFDGSAADPTLVLEGPALDLLSLGLGTPEGRAALRQAHVRVLKGPRGAEQIRSIVNELFDFGPADTPGRALSSTPNRGE